MHIVYAHFSERGVVIEKENASLGAKPPGALGPRGAQGLGRRPTGPKPKLPQLGRRLEVLAGVRGVTRHVYVVPMKSSHVGYP